MTTSAELPILSHERDTRPADRDVIEEHDTLVRALLMLEGIVCDRPTWGAKIGGRKKGAEPYWSFRTWKGGKTDCHNVPYRRLSMRDANEIISRHLHGTVRP